MLSMIEERVEVDGGGSVRFCYNFGLGSRENERTRAFSLWANDNIFNGKYTH